jgi:cell shape-determining protein MreC
MDENTRLAELLQLDQYLGGESLPARVIGKDFNPSSAWCACAPRPGESDPGRRHSRIGLAASGSIRRTEGKYSDVLLTADQRSALDVRVRRRRNLRGRRERSVPLLNPVPRPERRSEGRRCCTPRLRQAIPASSSLAAIERLAQEYGLYQEVRWCPP